MSAGAKGKGAARDQSKDQYYALGQQFLGLQARVTREGDVDGEVIGTSAHLEIFGSAPNASAGAPAVGPPYRSVAFEPSTGRIIDVREISGATAFEAYDDALWGFIQSFLGQAAAGEECGPSCPPPDFRPAVLTTTDVSLADYVFGVLQGCGTDVRHVSPDDPVQWAAAQWDAEGVVSADAATTSAISLLSLSGAPAPAPAPGSGATVSATTLAVGAQAEGAPARLRLGDALARVMDALARSGRLGRDADAVGAPLHGGASPGGAVADGHAEAEAEVEAEAGAKAKALRSSQPPYGTPPSETPPTEALAATFVLLGACHDPECAKLVLRAKLRRCSVCKRALYCSAECQAQHWKTGHRAECAKATITKTWRPAGAQAAGGGGRVGSVSMSK